MEVVDAVVNARSQVEVDVACSVEQVYALWNNLENVPGWMPLVKSVKPLPGETDLWRWQFGVRFPLIVEWVSRIEQRIPGRLIAWFEAFVGNRWYTFDATQAEPRGNRIAIAYGRDAADVALANQFGLLTLTNMQVWVKAVNP